MSCEEQVLAIRKQLEKITTDGASDVQAMDLLKQLGELNITLDILTSTRIGMTVNALRKSSTEEETITVAKTLIKSWKKMVPESAEKKAEKRKEEEERAAAQKKESKPSKSYSRPDFSGDEVRSGCRKLLLGAIRGTDDLPEGCNEEICQNIATDLEEAIFSQFKQTNQRYKTQIRSRVFNLKDKKNPMLRMSVLCGMISAEKLAKMTSEDMANDEVKKQREAFIKQGIDSSRLAIAEGTKTDLLTCGKCRKNNCTYNQMQTRSADEPMTTFVLCNECGNRWKFC